MEKDVIVIGGGASGMTAAYFAALRGNRVVLLEKNEKLGKKIYITGKGRCNFTNDSSPEEAMKHIVSNPKFMTGALRAFPPESVMRFFEDGGLRIKTERGNRVFPLSDHASDVTKTLEQYCRKAGVEICLKETVRSVSKKQCTMPDILSENNTMFDIVTDCGARTADAVIVATGGLSYPTTGSTGDGYRFAREFGHSTVAAVPALCGIETEGTDCAQMQGLSLKNVRLSALRKGREIASFFGEMLFTHFGISGPSVLSLSSHLNRLPLPEVELRLDLKPALTGGQLDQRLLRDFDADKNKAIGNVLGGLLPKAMISVVLRRANISPQKPVNSVTKAERKGLLSAIKCFIMIPSALRPIEEAIVTAGGVSVREINPGTMESKLVPGLFFCGEVLDLDAYTGGFNLQIAFSTGYAAGNAV